LWSSCQDLWTFLPESCGSGHGIVSVESDTEEVSDGHDLAATAAFTTDANVSAPPVAGATPSLTEEAFFAARTFIDGPADQPVFAPQLVSDVGEGGGVQLAVAESIGLLTTPWLAETPTSVGLELCTAHRAGRQRVAIVTRIVTHGVRAHAATACARSAERASSRRS
jgi:hypothetical protein